jgi:uncharacterized protein (DUF2249 family)
VNLEAVALFLIVITTLSYFVTDTVNPKNFSELCLRKFSWGGFALSGGLKVMYFYSLLMVDWDIKKSDKDDSFHYTVSSFEDIETIITSRVKSHTEELWALYKTPGGGHAFLISHHKPVEEGIEIQAEMKGDLCYRHFTKERGQYNVRIQQKRGRENDFIASFQKCIGTGASDPELVQILRIHDLFVKGNKFSI